MNRKWLSKVGYGGGNSVRARDWTCSHCDQLECWNARYTCSRCGAPRYSDHVKSTSPDTQNHDKIGYVKLYDDKNLFMTNVDNSDTTYTNKHKDTKYNVRDMYE